FSVFTGQIMINHSQFCFRGILWFSHKTAPYSVGCPTFGVQSSTATGDSTSASNQKRDFFIQQPCKKLTP
ncbi:hypothetical protein, partial [Klebsiella pneumoniae]|uniref:hypothetical protein n=1 Tax=Klebsiella pneumoniae TaxID=573 RepID=UPI003EE06EDF